MWKYPTQVSEDVHEMLFVSAAIVFMLFVVLVLPSVVCGKKSEGKVVSSAKKTDKDEVKKEAPDEETEDSE
ncbi:MAG: hypothetical protein ACFFF4_07160 [Candidatus Thorarchaeota archaeon]